MSLHPPFGVAAVPYAPPPAGEAGGAVVFLTAGIGITTRWRFRRALGAPIIVFISNTRQ